jgi:hypothetical protein
MSDRPARLFLLLLTALLLLGCSSKKVADDGPDHRDHFFVDGVLGFAMEYPAHWLMTRNPVGDPGMVVWQSPRDEKSLEAGARASVASFSRLAATEWPDKLLDFFSRSQPDFVKKSDRQIKVAATAARELTGAAEAGREFLVYLLTGTDRAFLIEFSTPPGEFKKYRRIFEEMIESFMILERPPSSPATSGGGRNP